MLRHYSNTHKYQITAFFYVLILAVVAGCIFSSINLYQQRYTLALVQIIFTILSAVLLIFLLQKKLISDLDIVWRLYIGALYLALLSLLVFAPTMQATIFSVIFLIPCMSYLLLGQRWGFAYTVIFSTSSFGIYLFRFSLDDGILNAAIVGNLSVCLITVWLFSHLYEKTRLESQKTLLKVASEDSQTGLLSQSVLRVILSRDLKQSIDNKKALSIAVIDIDWFRIINNNYGYDIGDKILFEVAQIIKTKVRFSDSVFRLGGEEFCVSLPNTSLREASQVIEKIRTFIEQKTFEFDGIVISLTISAGIADYYYSEHRLDSVFELATKRACLAKSAGRNQIVMDGF